MTIPTETQWFIWAAYEEREDGSINRDTPVDTGTIKARSLDNADHEVKWLLRNKHGYGLRRVVEHADNPMLLKNLR